MLQDPIERRQLLGIARNLVEYLLLLELALNEVLPVVFCSVGSWLGKVVLSLNQT